MFDERQGVANLCASLRDFAVAETEVRSLELVLVDDGSNDGTADAVREAITGFPIPTQVREHGRNLGLCAALRTGSEDTPDGWAVVWLDADLSYRPPLIGHLAAALDEGQDLALSSCHHPDGELEGVPGWRRLLSRQASRVHGLASGRRLRTFTSMVRAQRIEVLNASWPERSGFAGITEQLLRALATGAKAIEVPATLHPRTTGRSKLRLGPVIRAHLGLAWAAYRAKRRGWPTLDASAND